MRKSLLYLMTSLVMCGCNAYEEPLDTHEQSCEAVISELYKAGFVKCDSLCEHPDYTFSASEDVISFISKWKEQTALMKNEIEGVSRSMATVKISYMGAPQGSLGIYSCEYKGIAVEFRGPSVMSNEAHLLPDAVNVYATGLSWPFTQTHIKINKSVVWTSGYNHVFVSALADVTLEFEGMTFYQGAKLANLIFVLNIANRTAVVEERQVR